MDKKIEIPEYSLFHENTVNYIVNEISCDLKEQNINCNVGDLFKNRATSLIIEGQVIYFQYDMHFLYIKNLYRIRPTIKKHNSFDVTTTLKETVERNHKKIEIEINSLNENFVVIPLNITIKTKTITSLIIPIIENAKKQKEKENSRLKSIILTETINIKIRDNISNELTNSFSGYKLIGAYLFSKENDSKIELRVEEQFAQIFITKKAIEKNKNPLFKVSKISIHSNFTGKDDLKKYTFKVIELYSKIQKIEDKINELYPKTISELIKENPADKLIIEKNF